MVRTSVEAILAETLRARSATDDKSGSVLGVAASMPRPWIGGRVSEADAKPPVDEVRPERTIATMNPATKMDVQTRSFLIINSRQRRLRIRGLSGAESTQFRW